LNQTRRGSEFLSSDVDEDFAAELKLKLLELLLIADFIPQEFFSSDSSS